MIKIAVVEDEEEYRRKIAGYIKKFSEDNELPIQVVEFKDGIDIVNNYKPLYDLIFLDIQMKNLDGIKAAEIIRKYDKDVIIIFITNMVQYALKGYEVNAYDFVPKPITYPAFEMKMNKLKRRFQAEKEHFLLFPFKSGLAKIAVEDVCYIEVSNHKLYCHMRDTVEKLTSGTLTELEEKLQADHFVRCSNSYLVNLKYVTRIEKDKIVVGKERIALSRSRKKEFLTELTKYVGGKF